MQPLTRRRFVLTTAGLWLGAHSASASEPVRLKIVVAKSSVLRDISLADLHQLYRGRPLKLAGQDAVPFNHPVNTPDRIRFDQVVLGMDPDEAARYWVDQKIRGGNAAPRKVDSVNALVHTVSAVPGALVYLRDGFEAPELKAVSIDGKLPSDPGYALVSAR